MTIKNAHGSASKVLAPLLLLGMGLALAGCRTNPNMEAYSSIPPLHYQRHPIHLTRSNQTAMIDVTRNVGRLTGIQRADTESFVRAFRSDGSGPFVISVPAGGANELSAMQIARQVRDVASAAGVPAGSITMRPYSPQGNVQYPPLILSYGRLRAGVPHACGTVKNLDMGHENLPYENHGCASQSNLAAMLANPNDINTPRPLDTSDASRRYTVIDKYRQGQVTSSEVRNTQTGSVSSVGR